MAQKILAIILARGSSKGIPHKNLVDLAGKPLLHYTIESAKKSDQVSTVLVSSDDDKILNYASKQGVLAIKRPPELAKDDSTSEQSLMHAIKQAHTMKIESDFIMLLQPTSPLRSASHISQAVKKMLDNSELNSLISVAQAPKNPYLLRKISDKGYLEEVLKKPKDLNYPMNRGHAQDFYYINGALYLVKTDLFLKTGSLYPNPVGFYLMDKRSSLDIDDPIDLLFAQSLLKTRKE